MTSSAYQIAKSQQQQNESCTDVGIFVIYRFAATQRAGFAAQNLI